jgi:hypothetical protein
VEYQNYVYVLDENKIRVFENDKNLKEINFVNSESFYQRFRSIDSISLNKNQDVLYAVDSISNKIHRIDFEISTLSFIYDTIELGGYGDENNSNKFNNPIKILAEFEHVYVLDYNNNCIKKYNEDLSWINTYQLPTDSKIEDFIVLPKSEILYILDENSNITILYDDVNLEIKTSEILMGSKVLSLSFDESGEFFYILTDKDIHKFTTLGVYIGVLNVSNGFSFINFGKNRSIILSRNNQILRLVEIVETFEIGRGLFKTKWNKEDLFLSKDDFADDNSYNLKLKKFTQNIKTFRDSINSKFVIIDEISPYGKVTYFAQKPTQINEIPIFSDDVENENIKVGVNEFHIPQVFNREFSKLYTALEKLKTFFDINLITNNIDGGCDEVFCWSWKAMSCYSLSLPAIKICGINPITYAELKSDFLVDYAPTKDWNNATASCCIDVKSPL